MDNTKKFKRGEYLFKEGEVPSYVYLIQSGRVALVDERNGRPLEFASAGGSQVLGEGAIFSNSKFGFSAQAAQETKLLEVPIELFKQQYEKCPPGVKIMLKSMSEDLRQARQQIKMFKAESETAPCPQGMVHRIFSEMHLISRHIGKVEGETAVVSWSALKLYATRFFAESPQRLRSLIDLMTKLKMVEVTFGKNEEGEQELQEIKISSLKELEDFAEFYQYHLYKGGRSEAIYVEPLALKIAKAIYEISAEAPVDHRGASKMEFGTVVTEVKAQFQIDLKVNHLDILERKGLFTQRESRDEGSVILSFDRKEFGKMTSYWAVLWEIDKWNEKGFVDLKEAPQKKEASDACPQCRTSLEKMHKFCPNCGFKMAA